MIIHSPLGVSNCSISASAETRLQGQEAVNQKWQPRGLGQVPDDVWQHHTVLFRDP